MREEACSVAQGYCGVVWADVTVSKEIKPWGLESGDGVAQGELGKGCWEEIGLLLRVLLRRS